jgi:hypothetical protein
MLAQHPVIATLNTSFAQRARLALTTDPQLADRFEAFELPAWQNDEAFLRLLASF